MAADSQAEKASRNDIVAVNFELDMRTHALVQILGLPDEDAADKKAGLHPKTLIKFYFPFVVFVGVGLLQILMTLATWAYVTNGLVLTRKNPILTSYEIFVGSNQTLPKGLAESVCGAYQDLEMTSSTAGPLNQINMPDGATYKPGSDYDLFYHLKMPFRSFNYAKMGPGDRSVLDDTLYVIHEGLSVNPGGKGAGYSMLFILMMAMWLFALFVEYRQILSHLTLFSHFQSDPNAEECFEVGEDGRSYKLVKISPAGRFVLLAGIVMRTLVTTLLLLTGCQLLINTTNKIDLILNALALLFVLEISSIFFFASVSGVHQRHIQDIETVLIELPRNSMSRILARIASYAMPALPFILNFMAAAILRLYQLRLFRTYMRITAAMCLFAGATPGGEGGLVAPITGFCDTLLSVRCAPEVTPKSSLEAHGRCVISDQGTGKSGTTFLYMDDERLFEGRAKSKSWASWGAGMPELYDKGLWSVGPYQDIMRKNCLQMYQKTGVVEDRMVDPPTKELMYGAPFYCSKDAVWKALFGKFTEGVGAVTELTMDSMDQVADLRDPAVVAAIDACQRDTPVVGPHARPYLLSTDEKVNAHQRKKGGRQKKLGAAGMLSIPRPHK